MAKRSNIRRRGSSWVVHARVNGRQVWRSFKTRDEAETFLSQALALRASGETLQRPERVRFKDAAEDWYSTGTHERGWKPSTRRDYRSVLDAYLIPAFGDFLLDRITADQITAWRGRALAERKLSRRTAEKLATVLHAVFEHGRRRYRLPANPVEKVERLAQTYSGALDFYSPEEVFALVRAAESEQDAAIFLTAAFTGLRRGEIVALHVRDVDFERRVIRIAGSYGDGELAAPKSGKARAVPMATELATVLARLLTARGDPAGDELVFPGERGDYLDASALRRRYVKAQKAAGLRPLRFHDLRHTFGSIAVNRTSIVHLQAWMGHADVKTTMRYLHYKSHAAEAELLDGAFAPALVRAEEVAFR